MIMKLNVICLYFFIGSPLAHGYEWKYEGCYKVGNGKKVLDGYATTDDKMTPSICETKCTPHRFFGLLESNKCICGENIEDGLTNSLDCKSQCSGDVFRTCGGPNDMVVYKKPDYYMGCYLQTVTGSGWIELQDDATLTPEKCRKQCGDSTYTYAALQSQTCYCGNNMPEHSTLQKETDCNTACSEGNRGCGGNYTVNVYESTGYIGCFAMNDVTKSTEVFGPRSRVESISNNFVQGCMVSCKNNGYDLTAISGGYCHCGNKQSTKERLSYERCSTKCSGDNGRNCGGTNAVSIYETPEFYFGCVHFPNNDEWEKLDLPGMTLTKCRSECGSRLFELAGLKVNNNQDDCYCSNKIHSSAQILDKTHCKPCPDDNYRTCGGNDSISVYAAADMFCHCKVQGDPHFTTFDELHYDFQGNTTYILAKTIGNTECKFHITAKNKPIGDGKYTVTDYATLNIEGMTYIFHNNGTIEVNNILIKASRNETVFNALVLSQYSQIDTKKCGVIIRLDNKAHLDIYLKKSFYRQRVKGTCGDCDDDRLNDFRRLDGINVANSPQNGQKVGESFELK